MNYQSEGEYNADMQSQGEAESEWQAYADYQNYLGSLYENGDFKLYFLHTIADDLESFKFKQSNKAPSQYLRDIIYDMHSYKKDADSNNTELPF